MIKLRNWIRKNSLEVLLAVLLVSLLLLASCSMLPSMPWSASPEVVVEAPKQTATAELLDTATESIWRFGWMAIFLVLVFPRMREPLVLLWTALFRALAIPFLALRRWYDGE
jgi:hypothetical protein